MVKQSAGTPRLWNPVDKAIFIRCQPQRLKYTRVIYQWDSNVVGNIGASEFVRRIVIWDEQYLWATASVWKRIRCAVDPLSSVTGVENGVWLALDKKI